jgi:regulator of nonsense transcripts 1
MLLFRGIFELTISYLFLELIQSRMHHQICDFSSREFYEGKLQTGVKEVERPLPESEFVWPRKDGRAKGSISRCVFIPCSKSEDIGQKSKSNKAQARLCYHVVRKLRSSPETSTGFAPTIAILTPYTRQAELLRRTISLETVSSIDAFQGREADIIIFVTVRSNVHKELGFLKDMKRLNVALTRAKTGLIIIGDNVTLAMGEDESAKVWGRLIDACAILEMKTDEDGNLISEKEGIE